MNKLVPVTLLAAFVSLVVAALAFGGATKEVMLGAKLDPMQDHAKGAPHATGAFTATLKGHDLVWRLTFSKLSGPAAAAHIHAGRAGVAGPVLIPLCAPCRSGQHGTAMLSAMDVRDLTRSGVTYVNVHTKRNPNGEIRGQIAVH